MDARARYEATMEAGPPEGEPEPCPVCGEPLTELMDGGSECEANGCTPCPVCCEGEATDGGRPCAGCLLGEDEDRAVELVVNRGAKVCRHGFGLYGCPDCGETAAKYIAA